MLLQKVNNMFAVPPLGIRWAATGALLNVDNIAAILY
jgi:hypothetical protein